jgi:hypothetical protein
MKLGNQICRILILLKRLDFFKTISSSGEAGQGNRKLGAIFLGTNFVFFFSLDKRIEIFFSPV